MNIFQKSISLFIAVMTVFAAQAKNYEVASPSGDLRAVVSVTNSGTTLSVFAGETEVLAPSPISALQRKQRLQPKATSFMTVQSVCWRSEIICLRILQVPTNI